MNAIESYFIDIDDTLIRFVPGADKTLNTGSLRSVLIHAAKDFRGLPEEEAIRRIGICEHVIPWWSWSDFLTPLELTAEEFWPYALEQEQKYLRPAEPELKQTLQALAENGVKLYIASNNPQDGIRHKLRLAGVPESIFTDLFGATRMQAMKNTPAFWHNVLRCAGGSPQQCASIGDNPHDDVRVPLASGMGMAFLIERDRQEPELSDEIPPQVWRIGSLRAIVENKREMAI
ncbi:MAG: HAD family hydrolase [Victivallaceae bacterium]|nr:HAD family hydrolase [Victivallaceae bacterium]